MGIRESKATRDEGGCWRAVGSSRKTLEDTKETGSGVANKRRGTQVVSVISAPLDDEDSTRSGGDSKPKPNFSRRKSVGHQSMMDRQQNLARALLQEVLAAPGAVREEWVDQLQQAEKLLRTESNSQSVRSSMLCRHLLDAQVVGNGEGPSVGRQPTVNTEVRSWLRGTYIEEDARVTDSLAPAFLHEVSSDAKMREEGHLRYLSNPELVRLLSRVQHFDLNVAAIALQPEVANRPLHLLFGHVMQQEGLLSCLPQEVCADKSGATMKTLETKLNAFVSTVEETYNDVIFHNNLHAADVMMVMHWFFSADHMQRTMSTFDHLLSLIAAAVHDLAHDGVTNMFHIKTRSELAIRYNDRSVLESMHAATTFELMRENEALDFLSMINTKFQLDASAKAADLQTYFRKNLIEMVLATDSTQHDLLMAELTDLAAVSSSKEFGSTKSDCLSTLQQPAILKKRQLLLKVLLHASDVSNPTRPRKIMLHWSRKVLMEFWAQGDEERRLGLEISPMCDRAIGMNTVPNGQIGFISFIVKPLYLQVVHILPEVQEAVRHMEVNVAFWHVKKQAGAHFDDIFEHEEDEEEVPQLSASCSSEGD